MPELEDICVVVTGGAGFIGSHVVDALFAAQARRVVVVDNFFLGREENLAAAREDHGSALHVYREDASDLAAMTAICRAHRPQLVINLATKALLYSFFNPAGAFAVNVNVAMTLAELLRDGGFDRLVQISSSEVYGTARTAVMTEDHPLAPETSYAAGKAGADLLLGSYVEMYGLDIVTVRPFNNYGPRQNDGRFAAIVPATIRRISSGEPPVIEGDGTQSRDFMFVRDTAESVIRIAAIEDARGMTLNLGSGEETTVRELISTLCDICGWDGEVRQIPERAADVRRHRADVTRAQALLGSLPRTELRTGLQHTREWYHAAVMSNG